MSARGVALDHDELVSSIAALNVRATTLETMLREKSERDEREHRQTMEKIDKMQSTLDHATGVLAASKAAVLIAWSAFAGVIALVAKLWRS